MAYAEDLKSYFIHHNNQVSACHKRGYLHNVPRSIVLHNSFTFPLFEGVGGGRPLRPNNTPSSAEKFTSTNVRIARSGSAPLISPAKIAAPVQKKRVSRRQKVLQRTGFCSSMENFAAAKSKQKKLFVKHPNSFCVNTTSSRRGSAARYISGASIQGRRYISCRSSAPWAFQKSRLARFRNTALNATRKATQSAGNRRLTIPCIRKWSRFARH